MKTINFLAALVFAVAAALSFNSNAPARNYHNDCCDDKCLESSACCTGHDNGAQGNSENCCTDDCKSQACLDACKNGKSGASSTDSESNVNQVNKQESVNMNTESHSDHCPTGNTGCCK